MDILITDDDPGIRDLLEQILVERGHRVTKAEDGKKGLAHIKARENFDLAIVDIFMPEMDGLELIRELHGRCPALPIIAISGVRFAFDWSFSVAVDMGASLILKKPFSLKELTDAVDSLKVAIH